MLRWFLLIIIGSVLFVIFRMNAINMKGSFGSNMGNKHMEELGVSEKKEK